VGIQYLLTTYFIGKISAKNTEDGLCDSFSQTQHIEFTDSVYIWFYSYFILNKTGA